MRSWIARLENLESSEWEFWRMANPPSIYRGVNHESAQASLVRWTLSALRPVQHSIKCTPLLLLVSILFRNRPTLYQFESSRMCERIKGETLKFWMFPVECPNSKETLAKRDDETFPNYVLSNDSEENYYFFLFPLLFITKEKYFRPKYLVVNWVFLLGIFGTRYLLSK